MNVLAMAVANVGIRAGLRMFGGRNVDRGMGWDWCGRKGWRQR